MGVSIEQEINVATEFVAEQIRDQNCILFLGAGVHAPPPEGSPFEYPEQRRPPLGSALSEQLARECGLAADESLAVDPTDLPRVALYYEIHRSRNQLVEALARAVGEGREPSPLLLALAQLDFPVVITTNYDRLFERALGMAGKEPRVSTYAPDSKVATPEFRRPTAQSPVVCKIHGDIAQPETVVITDEDYIQFVLRMGDKEPYDPIPLKLKCCLMESTTLFVGYSLLDYNLRLLFKTLRWKVDAANLPDMYSVDRAPDPLIADVWHNQRRYVKFIAQDAWSFVPRLYEATLGRPLEP